MAAAEELKEKIDDWLFEYEDVLEDDDHEYISSHLRTNQDPFGYFYLLYKIHKLPSLENVELCPTRPVCSSCGSIDHPLGAWVNKELQPVAQAQPSFIKNSEALLKSIREVKLPPNSFLFTADASAMYTNIDTDTGLDIIPKYLLEHESEFEYNAEALIAALEIVFRHNLFRFGNAYVKQKSGTAMGKRPAPPWATIFFAIHEGQFVPQFEEYLLFYRRYLDDIIGIWLAHPDPATNLANWNEFKATVGNFHGLEWTFTPLARSDVAFMDMSLSIENDRVESTLYEKKLALYLYIPPNSAHPPGVTAGLVMGNVLRIMQLCTKKQDIQSRLDDFLGRLLNRGHQLSTLLPLFDKAVNNANNYLSRSDDEKLALATQKKQQAERRVFLHVPFHPDNPTASTIQRIWRETVAEPPGMKPLNQMTNIGGAEVAVDKLIIANHRAPNLGNLLSYRKIADRQGPKVSSFI
jgi:hypothetical protein